MATPLVLIIKLPSHLRKTHYQVAHHAYNTLEGFFSIYHKGGWRETANIVMTDRSPCDHAISAFLRELGACDLRVASRPI